MFKNNSIAHQIKKLERDMTGLSSSQIIGGDNTRIYQYEITIENPTQERGFWYLYLTTQNPFPLYSFNSIVRENGQIVVPHDDGCANKTSGTLSGDARWSGTEGTSANFYRLTTSLIPNANQYGVFYPTYGDDWLSPTHIGFTLNIGGIRGATVSYSITLQLKCSSPGILQFDQGVSR